MGRLLRDDLTEDQYASTMRGLHAIYAPIEAELTRIERLDEVLPDLPARMKTGALESDLESLPVSANKINGPLIDPITNVPAAMGTLYVLEGSTMGGRLIAAKLKTRDFVKPGSLHFFEHYGAESHRYWQSFVRALDQIAEPDHAAVIRAAQRTFEYFIALA